MEITPNSGICVWVCWNSDRFDAMMHLLFLRHRSFALQTNCRYLLYRFAVFILQETISRLSSITVPFCSFNYTRLTRFHSSLQHGAVYHVDGWITRQTTVDFRLSRSEDHNAGEWITRPITVDFRLSGSKDHNAGEWITRQITIDFRLSPSEGYIAGE